MALTRSDFTLRDSLESLEESYIKSGKRVELVSGTRFHTSDTDEGEGILLKGGNYANPIKSSETEALVIPFLVAGVLVPGSQVNQLRDSGSFVLPFANTVPENATLTVEVSDFYSSETPTVTTSGSDLIESSKGTDTLIEWVGPARLTFTSDGISRWRL